MDQNNSISVTTSNNLKKIKITSLTILCTVFSIGSFITDVFFDIYVAVQHYLNGKMTYLGLTIFFILLPGIIITVFSVWWYLNDLNESDIYKVSSIQWIIRITFLIFLMAPVVRNLEALYYARQSSKSKRRVHRKNYARKMTYENSDAALLRLIEAFMECAPQLILQIYILAQTQHDKPNKISETEIIQILSVFASIISMAFGIVTYMRVLRESLDDKREISCSVSIFLILFRFFEITARAVVLGLTASLHLPLFFFLCGVHCSIMFVSIRIMNTDFCNNKPGEFVYNLILSVMYLFCFINPKDNNTQTRYMLYYLLIFVENACLISLWYHHCSPGIMFRLPALIMVFVCFALAIFFMVFYYVVLHPTRGFLTILNQEERTNNIAQTESYAQFMSQFRASRANLESDIIETTLEQDIILENIKPKEVNCKSELSAKC